MRKETLLSLITASREGKSTLVIKNAKIVNVFTGEIIKNDVAVYDDTIIGIGKYSGENEFDAEGAYLAPGFFDAHVHIESSMVIPASYAKTVLPFGTTSVIADPHEIANVCGIAGIEAMLDYSRELPLSIYMMLPSCVPATPFEHNGCVLSAAELESLKNRPQVLGLGEVMNFMGVCDGESDMVEKLYAFQNTIIDGHAPLLTGKSLNAYCAAGPMTDHECSNFDELMEKLRAGMRVLIRVGSAANGMEEMLRSIANAKIPTNNLLLCTDDKHIENIKREGHINHIMRMAVSAGISPVEAIAMGTINTARTYGLKRVGAIAPGYVADMVLLKDIKDFEVLDVFTKGERYEGFAPIPVPVPHKILSSVNIQPLDEKSLRISVNGTMPVVKTIPGQLVTKLVYRDVQSKDGYFLPSNGLVKLAVIERHHATGNIGLGIVEGMPIVNGALAATVAHDSHNIVVMGDNDRDMLIAVEGLKDCGGGYIAVSGGVVLARLPLPIAGLMSDAPVGDVLARQRALLDAAMSMGLREESDPLIALSFMALPVIPAARVTDMGMFDAVNMRFI